MLIVDDDAEVRTLLTSILKDEGYSVDAVENGQNAVETCKKLQFDAALIDIDLPDMKGIQLLSILKKIQPSMVKIIITGHPSIENAVKAVNEKADGYLLKPFDAVELLETIKELIAEKNKETSRMNILFMGAHPDDVELGCGGTLIKHVQNGNKVYVLVFTDGEEGKGGNCGLDRIQESTQALTYAGVPLTNIKFLHFPDTGLWQERQKVMNAITDVCEEFQIQIVYTHSNKAYHQDHVTIYDETMRGAKKATGILAYETHGGMNPFFSPTFFVDIGDVIDKKIAMLKFHQSQISKNYLNVESVIALAQFRSSQSEEFHYAEAFEVIKMSAQWGW